MLVSTAFMFFASKRSTVWNMSGPGTPSFSHALRYAPMFSICLNGMPDVVTLATLPGCTLFTSCDANVGPALGGDGELQAGGAHVAEHGAALERLGEVKLGECLAEHLLDPLTRLRLEDGVGVGLRLAPDGVGVAVAVLVTRHVVYVVRGFAQLLRALHASLLGAVRGACARGWAIWSPGQDGGARRVQDQHSPGKTPAPYKLC